MTFVSDPFLALARRKGIGAPFGSAGADLCLALAKALLRATKVADAVAFPRSRA
jgi:hypothetical protein